MGSLSVGRSAASCAGAARRRLAVELGSVLTSPQGRLHPPVVSPLVFRSDSLPGRAVRLFTLPRPWRQPAGGRSRRLGLSLRRTSVRLFLAANCARSVLGAPG